MHDRPRPQVQTAQAGPPAIDYSSAHLAVIKCHETNAAVPQPITHCRICGNSDLEPILALGDQYLTGVFPASLDENITCGPLELVKCMGNDVCGLVQLRHSYDLSEMYGANYGYRSGLNHSMVAHLQKKVARVQQYAGSLTSNDLVLDIGSNDGTLLGFYPQNVTRVGTDPTASKFRQYYPPGIEIIEDFFSAEKFKQHFGKRRARIITSIAMLYDLEAPMTFVEEIASVLHDDGIWHFEQSYLPAMLETNSYDTVCHEHLEYYGLKQIKWMTDRCGLTIVDVELNDINGGSFAVTIAKEKSSIRQKTEVVKRIEENETALALETRRPYEQFRNRVFQRQGQLVSMLDALARQGAQVIGYGASTKGNVILQFCGIGADQIRCIAEVNPYKFGRFTPGTGIPIVSEAEAHAMKPDYFLVLPWAFRDNLLKREAAFRARGGRMIFPLPELDVVC